MNERTRRQLAAEFFGGGLLFCLLGTAGCAIEFGIDSAGKTCIGFGCPRATAASNKPEAEADRLTITFIQFTQFASPVKPSVDNFMNRYRSDPTNAQIAYWIKDFFDPARRVLGMEFEFDPNVSVKVNPNFPTLTATVSQADWREVTSGQSFERFAALAQLSTSKLHSLRWKTNVVSIISATSDNRVDYISVLEIILEKRERGDGTSYSRVATANYLLLQDLAHRLNKSLMLEYKKLFEQNYGLRVTAPLKESDL